MAGDLSKDWLVYVLIAGMIWFFTYVILKGNQGPKDGEQGKDKTQEKEQKK